MDVFKFMFARDGGNTSILKDGTKKGTRTMSVGAIKFHNKSIPELGNYNSNWIPPSRRNDKLVYKRNEVTKVEKIKPQLFELLSSEPRASLHRNFLSEKECEHLIELAKPDLERSVVGDGLTYKIIESSARTSSGAYLSRWDDEIIRNIEKRIADTTRVPIEQGDDLHVLRYEVGQKFNPHHDYINDPNMIEYGGQRIATFLMYLSPADEGGETSFPLAKRNITNQATWWDKVSCHINRGIVVKPGIGDAVFFWNVKPDGTVDPSSLHSGCPVIKGTKWCCTKWMHEKEVEV